MAAGGGKTADVQKEEDRLPAIVLAGGWVTTALFGSRIDRGAFICLGGDRNSLVGRSTHRRTVVLLIPS